MRLNPAPGYVILTPHIIKTKVGGYEMPKTESEETPELGTVVEVGDVIAKMPYSQDRLPKSGDVIAYKKYNHFVMTLGVKKYILVHFENILFTLEESK